MNSKKLKTILAILLTGSPALAAVSFSTNITATASAQIDEIVHYKHSLDCYAKKKGDDVHDKGTHGGFSSSGNNTYSIGQTATYEIWTEYGPGFHLAALNVTSNSLVNGDTETINFGMTSNAKGSQTKTSEDSKCRPKEMRSRTVKTGFTGSLTVNYVFGPGQYAVGISRKNTGVFLKNLQSGFNGPSKRSDSSKPDENILWGYPGLIIQESFTFPEQSPGNVDLGSYSLSFTKIGRPISDSASAETLITDTSKKTTELESLIQTNKLPVEWNRAQSNQLISLYFGILKSESHLAEALRTVPTSKVIRLIESIYRVASSDLKGVPDEIDLKMSAALASYQLSKLLLAELKPLCSQVEIQLPISGGTQSVLGLRAAYFWMNRAASVIKHYNFAAFRSLTEELARLESNGLTYDEVVSNEPLRKKLREASLVLLNGIDMMNTPFDRAVSDVNKVLKNFSDVGASGSTIQTIVTNLNALKATERRFIKNFNTELQNYKKGNTNKVTSGTLLADLNRLESAQAQIHKLMVDNIRYLNIADSPSTEGFLSELGKLILGPISVFEQAINVESFDIIRNAYIGNSNIGDLKSKMLSCVEGN